MMKVEQVIDHMVTMQHKKAVMDALIYCLEVYLPTDDGGPSKTLLVSEPCLIPQVPVKEIEAMLDALYDQSQEFEKLIESLKEMKVHVEQDHEDHAAPAQPSPDQPDE